MASNSDYKNLTLYGVSQEAVVSYLRRHEFAAFVTPESNGYVIVYEAKSDSDEDLMPPMASTISADIRCSVLAAMYVDDASFIYELYLDGALVDGYDSFAQYADEEASTPAYSRASAAKVCSAFHRPEAIDAVLDIFTAGFDGERERHDAFAAALGMPQYLTRLHYWALYDWTQSEARYLRLPFDVDRSRFVKI